MVVPCLLHCSTYGGFLADNYHDHDHSYDDHDEYYDDHDDCYDDHDDCYEDLDDFVVIIIHK